MNPVPAWYPDPAENKPAPMPLLRVQAFLNTEEAEAQTDLLSGIDTARGWFVAAGLLSGDTPLRPADLSRARAVRESVRALLAPDGSRTRRHEQLEPLQDLIETHRPQLTVNDRGVFDLENPEHDDLSDGLFDLLLIIRDAQEDGSWARLKACANPDCRWVYYDRSRNQHGNWCDMAVCGNRLKNRRLRARQR